MLLPKMNIIRVVSFQGNIGAGKTTVLDHLRAMGLFKFLGDSRVVFVDEPVDEWRKPLFYDETMPDPESEFKSEPKSMLDLLYKDIEKNAFVFQVNAFTTRQQALIKAMEDVQPHEQVTVVSERSMMTDRLFTENLYLGKKLRHCEWEVYNNFFGLVAGTTVKLERIIVYVDVDHRVCHERIARRKRGEEKTISLEYLKSLQERHEEMIVNFQADGGIVIRLKWIDTEEGSVERQEIIDDLVARIPVAISA